MSTDALNTFTDLLNNFERTVTFLHRIDEQAPNFRSEVVARVRASHEANRDTLLVDLIPALADAEEALNAANSRATEVQASVADAREALEEIELRVEIGALEAEDADAARAPYQAAIDGVADALAEVELEVEGYQSAITRWETLGQQGGVLR